MGVASIAVGFAFKDIFENFFAGILILWRFPFENGDFIEKPFQNWTRVTADLLGTVVIYADYTLPVEELRQELHRVLQTTDMWDGKVWGLQVTNATDRTIEMRALMSVADSGTGWDLRCYVREQLIGFMQKRHPEHLPKTRAEVQGVSLDRQKLASPSVPKS